MGGVGLVSLPPVVTVAAKRHHRLGLVQTRQSLVQIRLKPILTGNWTRITGRPVLVERHKHQGVAGRLERFERGGVVAVKGGDPHLAPRGVERNVGLVDQRRIGRQACGRKVFQVEDIAGIAAGVGQGDEVVHQSLPRLGIDQQPVCLGPVELRFVSVLDHRQDGRSVLGLGQDGFRLGILGHIEQPAIPSKEQPAGRQHVHLIHVPSQRHARTLVPGDIEADRERLGRGPGLAPTGPSWNPGPGRAAAQAVGGLDVQGGEDPGVLHLQVRQVGGEGQCGEEGGDHRRDQRQQDPSGKGGLARAFPRWIVENEVGHSVRRPRGARYPP